MFGTTHINNVEPRVSNFQVIQSGYGAPIPIVFGTARIPGRLLDYDDFTAIAHTKTTSSGGKGGGVKSKQTTWTYTTAAVIGIAEGQCADIGKIWTGKSVGNLSSENMTFFGGAVGQAPWGYMVSKHPGKAIGYSGVAYVAGVLDLNSDASMPNYNFEVYGLCRSGRDIDIGANVVVSQEFAFAETIDIANWKADNGVKEYVIDSSGNGSWQPIDSRYYSVNQKKDAYGNVIPGVYTYTFNFTNRTDGYERANPVYLLISYTTSTAIKQYALDANPADIITQLMTNKVWGAQFPAEYLGDLSTYRDYCTANGLLLSEVAQTQQQCADYIASILECTNSEAVQSQGLFRIVPYYDGLQAIYLITDDNLIDQGDNTLVVTRNTQADAYNVQPVEFTDRDNDYNTDTVYATDQGQINLYGVRQADTKQHHHIMNRKLAQRVAQFILQKQLYIRNQYVFRLPQEFILLDPMDAIAVMSELTGLPETDIRIVSIKENKDDYTLEITCEDNPTGAHSAPIYDTQSADRYQKNYNVDPGNINTPVIFEPPSQLTDTGLETWIAASGGPNWGGYSVWISEDNTTYKRVGTCHSPARYGTLLADLPVNGDTLQVQLYDTSQQLLSGTADDAQNLRTICWVDGEAIAYTTATLIGPGQYTLSGLVRGACNTPITAHATGSSFVRCDDALFKYPFDKSMIGRTIYHKLTAFNIYGGGEQALADVQPIAHTLTWQPPPDVSNITLDEDTFILKDGTTLTDIVVNFTAPTYAIFDHYNVYYDVGDSGVWKYAGPATSTGYKIKALPNTKVVKVRVTTVNKFGLESPGCISANYTIKGKSNPPPDVTGLTLAQDEYNRANIVVSWTPLDLNTVPDLKGYEVRAGDNWDSGVKVNADVIVGNTCIYTVRQNGTYYLWVKAIDNSGNYSANAAGAVITVNVVPDAVTNLQAAQEPRDRSMIKVSWTAPAGKDIAGYELRYGDSWDTGIEIASTKETTYWWYAPQSGTYDIMVRAKTVAGFASNVSNVTITATLEPPDVTGFTATQSLSDRTLLTLYWDTPNVQDVAYYEIRKGPTWDSGQIIGQRVTGTFFETRIYDQTEQTYWIKAVSVAGRYSLSPASISGIYNLAPAPVTNIQMAQDANDRSILHITWTGITESDLAYYELRVGMTWEDGVMIGQTKEQHWDYQLTQSGHIKVMIKSLNAAGYYSDEAFAIYDAVVEPSDVTGFQALQNGEYVEMYWDKATEPDVVAYEIREGASFDQGSLVASGVTVTEYKVKVDTERQYYYHIKAINRSLHYSQNAAHAMVTVQNLPPKNVIQSYDEIALQSGTHTNTEFGPSLINWQTIGGKWSDYPNTKFSDVGGQTVLKLKRTEADPTFTRASVAYKSDGTQVAANVPRIDGGIMVEEGTTNGISYAFTSDTNLLQYFTDTHSESSVTIDNTQTPPVSGQKVVKHYAGINDSFIEARDANNVTCFNASTAKLAVTGGTYVTFSIWAKGQNGGEQIEIFIFDYASDTGVNRVVKKQLFTITNTFQRYVVTAQTAPDAVRAWARVDNDLAGQTVYWCAPQLEVKAYATSFTPSTRSPETLTIPTEGVLNPQEGTLEYIYKPQTPAGVMPATSDPFLNDITVGNWSSPPYNGFLIRRSSSQLQVLTSNSLTYDVTFAQNAVYYVAFTWSTTLNKTCLYVNGTKVATVTGVPVAPTTSNIYIGGRPGYNPANALFDDLRISSRARTDAEIASAYANGITIDADTTYFAPFTQNALSVPLYRNQNGTYTPVRKDMGQVITANITADFRSSVILRGTGSAKLQMRLSQDGVTWSDWQDFRPAQYTFRYADFQVLLGTTDISKTPEVNHCTIRIDVPDTQTRGSVTVPVGGTTVQYGHTYYTVPIITPTAIGDNKFPQVTAKTNTDFTVKIVDRNGNDVGGQLDWTAIGY